MDGTSLEGEGYRFELATSFDLLVGLARFLGTPIGILVATGVVFAVVVFALGRMSMPD